MYSFVEYMLLSVQFVQKFNRFLPGFYLASVSILQPCTLTSTHDAMACCKMATEWETEIHFHSVKLPLCQHEVTALDLQQHENRRFRVFKATRARFDTLPLFTMGSSPWHLVENCERIMRTCRNAHIFQQDSWSWRLRKLRWRRSLLCSISIHGEANLRKFKLVHILSKKV